METTLEFPALDGRMLAATSYEPAGAEQGLVIFGALGVPRSYYRAFARWMAGNGVGVLTFDYRGCAGSASLPIRSDPATLLDWAQNDASAAVDHALGRWGAVWGLGHSFGGQAFGLTPRALDLAGAFVVAAGSGDLSLYPTDLRRKYGFLLGGMVPLVSTVFGYVPGKLGIGEDLPAGVVRQWAQWCHTPGYARGALGRDHTWYHRIEAPMAFIEVADDTFAPAAPAAELRSWYTHADVSHRTYAPAELGVAKIGHFGMFRPGPPERIWADILEKMCGAAAAGAVALAR